MAFLTTEKYTFVSQVLPEATFGVIDFKGVEGLNRCYEFEINLVSEEADIDLGQVLEKPATFTIRREGGDIPFHGIPIRFEQHQAFESYFFYRAVLVPRLSWLSLTHYNQVFLDKTLPEILEAVFKEGDLIPMDYELKLQKNYPGREYVCQYRESHLDFVSRWMERDGIYYYFEQDESGEKVILTDTKMAHTDMPQGQTIHYSPPSGLDAARAEEIVYEFVCRQRALPEKVRLKDYNYRTPSLEISGHSQVKAGGRGQVYMYGDHFRTPEEGGVLAAIRAEEFQCREKEFMGESMVPYLRPGYTFTLQDHYRNDFNQKYLTVEITHEGSQVAYLTSGIRQDLSEGEQRLFYRNSFTAIPAGVQFRPERKTERARFYGFMNAKIDAGGSGLYAELDDQGRYKVILSFDQSGRKDGKASAFLRMMQPYVGSNHGMHFPLHKGTEVLLTFIDGDPDRPIIAGMAPNPDHPSPVKDENQTMSQITTSGRNKIHMEDREGNQRILVHSPTENSFVRLGSHNDPPAAAGPFEEFWKGINISTDERLSVYAGLANTIILGENSLNTGGVDNKLVLGERLDTTLGHRLNMALFTQTDVKMGWHWNLRDSATEMEGFRRKLTLAETIVQGETTQIRGQADQAVANLQEAVGEANGVKGQLNRVEGSANRVRGQLDSLTGRADRIRGTVNDVKGQANDVHGELNDVVGEATEAYGDLNNVVGQRDRISGAVTKISTAINTMAAERLRANAVDGKI